MKKLSLLVLTALIAMVGYSVYNQRASRRARIPLSSLYVHVPFWTTPRLWGNAVEFDHIGWQTICFNDNGKVRCIPLKQASPTVDTPPQSEPALPEIPKRQVPFVVLH